MFELNDLIVVACIEKYGVRVSCTDLGDKLSHPAHPAITTILLNMDLDPFKASLDMDPFTGCRSLDTDQSTGSRSGKS